MANCDKMSGIMVRNHTVFNGKWLLGGLLCVSAKLRGLYTVTSVCNYLASKKKLEVYQEFVVCLSPILILLK